MTFTLITILECMRCYLFIKFNWFIVCKTNTHSVVNVCAFIFLDFKTVENMECSRRPQGFNEIKTEYLIFCYDLVHTAGQFVKWFSLTLLREVEQIHIILAC